MANTSNTVTTVNTPVANKMVKNYKCLNRSCHISICLEFTPVCSMGLLEAGCYQNNTIGTQNTKMSTSLKYIMLKLLEF